MTIREAENRNRERQRPGSGKPRPTIPNVIAGDWHAELLGGGSLHLGGTVNQAPARHAIEFSFLTLPAFAYGPGKIVLPAVIVLMPPAGPLEHADVGSVMQNRLLTMIDLFVTRPLFSDLVPRIESGRVKMVTFKVADGCGAKWPISLWSIGSSLAPGR